MTNPNDRKARYASIAAAACCALPAGAIAQDAGDLNEYFGFEESRIIVVDRGASPFLAADFNNDGLTDVAVVNNRKSRIELYLQRRAPRTDQDMQRDYDVNEIPPNRHYDHQPISVAHRVTAIAAHDVNGDGRTDIIYAGQPTEIVVLSQTGPGEFEQDFRRRVRGLAATRSTFAVADVLGGPAPELIAGVDGRINIYELSDRGPVGEPVTLGAGGAGESIVAFFAEDFTGDGLNDLLAVIPEHSAPLRLWPRSGGSGDPDRSTLGAELRFDSPRLREVEPVRFPGVPAASIAVIERATNRIIVYDLAQKAPDDAGAGERDARVEVLAFSGGAQRDRAVIAADLDADGLTDIIATDPESASMIVRLQSRGAGLGPPARFSAFKEPKALAVGQWDADPEPEVFVLSETEKTVGVAQRDRAGRLGFPQPIPLATAGATPVAMSWVALAGEPALVVIAKDRRDHTLEIHTPDGADPFTVELEGVTRPPQSILSTDINRDGVADLLLFTPGQPMVMVLADASGLLTDVRTEQNTSQFGLVEAAGPENTALLDVTGDGDAELLIADRNFVRVARYDNDLGWAVIDQITLPDPSTRFAALTLLREPDAPGAPPTLVAADNANRRLVMFHADGDGGVGAWSAGESFRLSALEPVRIIAGEFTGDYEPSILAISDDAVAVVRLTGAAETIEPVAVFRNDDEDRLEHEITVGDVNGDGHTDMVVLDAGEQMCEIFTFSASRRLFPATEFQVFQSRLFTGGSAREFEPSNATIADLTGDGANDLALLVHDRVIIYPQQTNP